MNDLRKRILLDLLITPVTVIPFLGGVSLLLLSEILGGLSAFLGFAGIVIAFGAFLTNLTFNLPKISKRALKNWHDQQVKQRERELDNLDRRLQKTDDDRDESALRNLRTLYNSFGKDVSGGKISEHVPPAMLQSVDDIFKVCIQKLERSYEIHRTAGTMNGKLRRDLAKQRDTIIEEVETSVAELADVISEVRALKFKNETNELKQLSDRLSSQLEIAKATEEGMADLMGDRTDRLLKEYEE